MKNECCICRHFTAYYTKAYCCYLREDCGWCAIKKQLTHKHESCESWKSKSANTKMKRGIVVKCLADAITNISVIKDFLTENTETQNRNKNS